MKKSITFIIVAFILLISLKASAQWVQVSGSLPAPQNVVPLVSNSSYLFAGLDGSGVYRSANDGTNWTAVNNGINNLWVKTLLISGNNIFAGNIGGVNFSTNNGSNWSLVGSIGDVVSFALIGTNIFAGTTTGGVFLSTNNGLNWTAVNSGLTNLYAYALMSNGTNLFAGTLNGGVFLSTNNGGNWTTVNSGLTNLNIRSFASIGTNIYAATQGGGVFLSTNNGLNWTTVNTGLSNLNVYSLTTTGTNLFVGNYNGGVFLSTNEGGNWTAVNTGLTATNEIHCLWISNSYLFASVYNGGVYRRPLSELISIWVQIPNGIGTSKRIPSIISNDTYLFAGEDGSGVFRSSNNGDNWTAVNNGLSSPYIKSFTTRGNNLFVGTYGGGICRSSNNGDSWTPVNNGLSFFSNNVNVVYSKDNLLFAGGQYGARRSTNNGDNWTTIGSDFSSYWVNDFTSIGNNLFTSTSNGIYLSTNNGDNWSFVNSLGIYNLTSVGSNLFAGSYVGGVYRSSNNGANFTAVNNGLSNLYISALFSHGAYIYSGSPRGVFSSSNNGNSWISENNGLDTTNFVRGLYVANNYLFAGTWGTSAWRRNLSEISTSDTTTRWLMQVKSQISTVYDNENFAGVADSATEGFDSQLDLPKPPPSPGNYITTYFSHPEWGVITGNDFARDIKKNTGVADTVKRWFFNVKTNVLNDTVRLTFVNDRIPSALGKYLTDLTTGQRINLRNLSEYKYYNTSAIARQFELIIGDSTAPALTMIYPLGSNIFRSGLTKSINWTTSDGTGIDSIFIYKSTDAGMNYTILKGVGFSQTTTWTIPNEYLNNNYSLKIISRDSLGNTNMVKSLNTFTVVGDSLATTANAGWNMICLPFISNDSMASKILGDDFGSNPYYVWGYGYTTGYYTAPYLIQNKGYWLGALSTTVWDIRGTAIEYDSTVQDLELGFNLIGNNYVRGISKNTLQFAKGGTQYTFTEAVSNGLISNVLYKFTGTGYASSDTLSLFSGYWLGVLQTGVKMVQKALPSTVIPATPKIDPTPDNWQLSLNAQTSTQTDEISMIGMRPDATVGYDAQYDAPRPPRAPGNNYLEVYFEHTGGNWPVFLGNKYASDITSPASGNWTFNAECSQTNTSVTINWDNEYLTSLGSSVSLMLTDNTNNQTVNMKTDSAYTFTYNGIRTFTISSTLTGINNPSELPKEYNLSQNYPNPFNPITTIKYQMPKSSHVTIKLYDILGKEVATLVNQEQQAGYYQTNFDARKLSSGIYFYKITAGDFVSIKKLVVLK